MSKTTFKFDPERPFGRVRTHKSQARYAQDGQYYDHYGNHLGPQEGISVVKGEPVEVPPVGTPSGNDALARASKRLGNTVTVGAVPSSVENAARENARALAAEENA